MLTSLENFGFAVAKWGEECRLAGSTMPAIRSSTLSGSLHDDNDRSGADTYSKLRIVSTRLTHQRASSFTSVNRTSATNGSLSPAA